MSVPTRKATWNLHCLKPPIRKTEAGSWAQLNVKEQNLTRHVPGGLGKKRIASNMGRNPRRIGRMFTDPQKRIFDRKIKGNGGVVLIDYSGSMSLSEKDVLNIMDAAPGCTVACYTTNIPRSRGGNGVDHPALVWAIQQKQSGNAPIVWVTDGGVLGPGQGYSDQLSMQCIKTCIKSKVLIRDRVSSAVELLNDIAARKPIKRWWPLYGWAFTGSRHAVPCDKGRTNRLATGRRRKVAAIPN